MRNKEELQTRVSKHGVMLEDDILDLYWEFYKKIPTVGSVEYKADEYKLARDLFDWNVIAKTIEPVKIGNGVWGRAHFFYRIF